ncbi:MAG: molybdopterin-dependent oxidoreductase [Acidobacteria bacterium]|nr:molybdopterin-dependent oxidoreductase [Acidobacteriota bacterium]
MSRHARLDRREFLAAGIAGSAAIVLGGCDRLSAAPTFREFLGGAEGVTRRVQRALLWRGALAREYRAAEISGTFRANGSQDAYNLPPGYIDAAAEGFPDWRLQVDGLVIRPARFTLSDLRALPARTQITRHDCVEGWSCIGGWTGPPLSAILDRVGLRPEARFIVFHCADELPRYVDGANPFYESIDLIDAYHPQTILAYEMNGRPLPVAHGAPLRLRVERQLGYKMAKFLARIEVVNRFDRIGRGRGGTWEDDGYEWYAGI